MYVLIHHLSTTVLTVLTLAGTNPYSDNRRPCGFQNLGGHQFMVDIIRTKKLHEMKSKKKNLKLIMIFKQELSPQNGRYNN